MICAAVIGTGSVVVTNDLNGANLWIVAENGDQEATFTKHDVWKAEQAVELLQIPVVDDQKALLYMRTRASLICVEICQISQSWSFGRSAITMIEFHRNLTCAALPQGGLLVASQASTDLHTAHPVSSTGDSIRLTMNHVDIANVTRFLSPMVESCVERVLTSPQQDIPLTAVLVTKSKTFDFGRNMFLC